jgi:predicted secreted protein
MMRLLFFTASLLIIGSCSLPEYKKESPEINLIPPRQKFRINLPEDHTTGNLWQLKQDYDTKVLQQINEVWHGNEKGVDFNLKTMSAGQTTLTFILRNYTDTVDNKQFIVKISE